MKDLDLRKLIGQLSDTQSFMVEILQSMIEIYSGENQNSLQPHTMEHLLYKTQLLAVRLSQENTLGTFQENPIIKFLPQNVWVKYQNIKQ